jgi:hypothetical protein
LDLVAPGVADFSAEVEAGEEAVVGWEEAAAGDLCPEQLEYQAGEDMIIHSLGIICIVKI